MNETEYLIKNYGDQGGCGRENSEIIEIYKKIFSHAATKKKIRQKSVHRVCAEKCFARSKLAWICLTLLKLYNEINRKDISFLFRVSKSLLKKIKCRGTGKASSNNYLTWTLHAVFMWLKVERSTLQFMKLNLLKYLNESPKSKEHFLYAVYTKN